MIWKPYAIAEAAVTPQSILAPSIGRPRRAPPARLVAHTSAVQESIHEETARNRRRRQRRTAARVRPPRRHRLLPRATRPATVVHWVKRYLDSRISRTPSFPHSLPGPHRPLARPDCPHVALLSIWCSRKLPVEYEPKATTYGPLLDIVPHMWYKEIRLPRGLQR
jgi:hypothetical protein